MIAWIYELIVGDLAFCRHEWETKDKVKVFHSGRPENSLPRYYRIHLCCKKCANWKIKDLE